LNLAYFKHIGKLLALVLVLGVCHANVSPISLSAYCLYGTPIRPTILTDSITDAVGFNVLLEWNATSWTSFGFSYEQMTFYGPGSFTAPMINFETRIFPMQNEVGKYSPYLTLGGGLNHAPQDTWQGPGQFKLGIGSRAVVAPPVYFDVSAESHWIFEPNSYQYMTVRAGLSYSFFSKAEPTATPTATVTPTPQDTPTPTPTVVPPATVGTVDVTISAAEWESLKTPEALKSRMLLYYRRGMKAFAAHKYKTASINLKKALLFKEKVVLFYYYAEAYSTLGVIYQFHSKSKNHNKIALKYYRLALDIDPDTKAAKMYYKKLKAKLKRKP
jgi:tetratricopeptide (TPR) repeat protein